MMKMEEEKSGSSLEETLTKFKVDFPFRGLSWAGQIYQRLESVNLECLVQKPTRYADAFGEQIKKMCTDVDDWLKPTSDKPVESHVPNPSTDHKALVSSDPEIGATDPTMCEEETGGKTVSTHVQRGTVVASEDRNTDISFGDDRRISSIDVSFPQHACTEESQSSTSSPIGAEEKAMFHKESEPIIALHPVNVKALQNDQELDEKISEAKMSPASGISYGENNACIPFEGDECMISVDVPEQAGIELSQDSSSVSTFRLIDHQSMPRYHVMSKVDQDKHYLNAKPSCEDIGSVSKNLDADRTHESAENGAAPEVNRIDVPSESHRSRLYADWRRYPCIEEPDSVDNVTSCSLCSTADNHDVSGSVPWTAFDLHYVPVTNGHNEHANVIRHGTDAPSVVKEAAVGYCDKLELPRSEELMGVSCIKLEEFKDIELGDCWDDLDHEELLVLIQRREANMSYKKKLKKKLDSIVWSLKNKASKQTTNRVAGSKGGLSDGMDFFAAAPNTVDADDLSNDPIDSDWEIV